MHRPIFVLIENVRNLDQGARWGESDRMYFERILQALGYLTVVRCHNASNSQCPQSRTRLYLMAVLQSSHGYPQNDSTLPDWVAAYHGFIQAIQVLPPLPLHLFLYADSHAEVYNIPYTHRHNPYHRHHNHTHRII